MSLDAFYSDKYAYTRIIASSRVKNNRRKGLVVTIIVLTIAIGVLYLNLGFFSPISGLRADLSSFTFRDEFSFQGGGIIRVEGWIYNYGPGDANVVVHLHVFYGTSTGYYGFNWLNYDVPVGIVPKNGGRIWFWWQGHLSPFDATTATFTYTISTIG